MEQLSLCSQVLLLPLGIPPMPAPARTTQSLTQDSEIWTALTTADVGNVIQGQGVSNHQVLPISAAQHV